MGKGCRGAPVVERSSELVELCLNRGGGIWRNEYDLYVAAVWSKVLDGGA
jgi:hypothetical protein